ncbi:unnamed protein product [Spirodela intermedia]|uniref:DUF1279 domain-containing protein n=1 Tax=Spirodela intermedia TaxID=51605 RepID=A0A7I8JBR4_SPIIN|nr:unnamed protein product [Spirodela intermedia]CAA6667617.1 unnamed protein product [Spirodela intermedia]
MAAAAAILSSSALLPVQSRALLRPVRGQGEPIRRLLESSISAEHRRGGIVSGGFFFLLLAPSSSSPLSSPAEEATENFGLEFGLWKIFSSKEGEEGESKTKTDQAKELLAKYGGAYLATSITLSLISFSLCYLLVNAGIDVQSLLQKMGISVRCSTSAISVAGGHLGDATGEKVGTFALAYAAHKAASPIRFPPTVALTPIVASWIGNKKTKDGE